MFNNLCRGGVVYIISLITNRKLDSILARCKIISMNIGDNVKRLKLQKNMSARELAERVGCSVNHIYRIEGNKYKDVPMATIEKLAKALGVSLAEIIGADIDIKYKTQEVDRKLQLLERIIKETSTSNVTPLNKPLTQIPVYGRVPAGYPREMWHDYIEEYIAIPDAPEGSFGLKVSGDSMIGEGIEEGDTVVIDPNQLAYNGDIVVAVIDGSEFTLKKFYQNAEHVILSPANSHYQPVVLPIESFGERVNIIGVMIGVYKRFKKKNRGGA